MKVFKGYQEITNSLGNPVVTIGNFDGLHLGHRKIIQRVLDKASEINGTSLVYTFRPHPQAVVSPGRDLQLLSTYEEKLELIESLGVDIVVEEPFSKEFSSISAERFFQEVILERLSAKAIIVGYDFGFGKGRSGSLDLLKHLCIEKGVAVEIVQPQKENELLCSSSLIRGLLKDGKIEDANRLLGRNFFYRGLVVHGDGRGHTIGFPTANILVPKLDGTQKFLIKEGVYASQTLFRNQIFKSVTNVGRRPTFHKDSNTVLIETHLLDFNGDLYGQTLEFQLVSRIRDEVKFPNIEALVSQIKKDVASARQ